MDGITIGSGTTALDTVSVWIGTEKTTAIKMPSGYILNKKLYKLGFQQVNKEVIEWYEFLL